MSYVRQLPHRAGKRFGHYSNLSSPKEPLNTAFSLADAPNLIVFFREVGGYSSGLAVIRLQEEAGSILSSLVRLVQSCRNYVAGPSFRLSTLNAIFCLKYPIHCFLHRIDPIFDKQELLFGYPSSPSRSTTFWDWVNNPHSTPPSSPALAPMSNAFSPSSYSEGVPEAAMAFYAFIEDTISREECTPTIYAPAIPMDGLLRLANYIR
ncbi:hypothetical protein O181_109132 [Austropuccinia psidii MF-1]|uniref:Uncharacterized protein n=1 Tax=Austropuccinia psidii MF-1 TaxID=1389203 RepID=A0A9Q3JX95_9BASI|nr:hypothetical protein [Austropuccinia psidii MF-1]